MFDFKKLFKKKEPQMELAPKIDKPRGNFDVFMQKVLTSEDFNQIEKCFVAVDLETTGFNPVTDDIIEYGAVVFENGQPEKWFNSLARPFKHIPPDASSVNGITESMLIDCRTSDEVAVDFYNFLCPYIENGAILVAHNADFDFRFLISKFSSNSISASCTAFDTLAFAQKIVKQPSYKLGALSSALHLSAPSGTLHRAGYDAELCGRLLLDLIARKKKANEEAISFVDDFSLDCAKKIKSILSSFDKDVSFLSFTKKSYLSADLGFYNVLKLKTTGRLKYALISKKTVSGLPEERLSAPSSAENTEMVRFSIFSVDDLDLISDSILTAYDFAFNEFDDYVKSCKSAWKKIELNLEGSFQI